jgi:hypothetical protein
MKKRRDDLLMFGSHETKELELEELRHGQPEVIVPESISS